MSQPVPAVETTAPVLPGVVVAACDLASAAALGLGCALFVWPGDDTLLDGARRPPLRAMAARVVMALALSAPGRAEVEGFAARWQGATGGADLTLVDLSATAPEAQAALAAQAVTRALVPGFAALARHNADLLQMLAQLRMAQEDLGIALRKSEALLLSQAQSTRWLVLTQGPLATGPEAAHCLMPGSTLTQRLKPGSEGLSDLAVFVPAQPIPGTGRLRARLWLGESGDLAAEWAIEAEALAAGWLRLSLVTALPDDLQTLTLELHWQGAVPLRLGAGLHHPDQVLCAQIEGQAQDQILAHRVWTFLAGRTPPLPVDGHCQIMTAPRPAGPLHLDPAHLERALEGDPDAPCLLFHRDRGALQVHPRPDAPSAARLPGAVPPGITRITARIGAPAVICPVIEYALAVVPRHPLRPLADLVATAAKTGLLSDWVRREGDTEGDVTLLLRAPTPEARDLLLITRVPPGQGASYGWATFRDIRMAP